MGTTKDRIQEVITTHDIVLFMKGVPAAPQCGFSAAVVHILSSMGVPFATVDVLQDRFIREGIKEFSQWPTIPQLYVKGEFVGSSVRCSRPASFGRCSPRKASLLQPHERDCG
jgi:monothiol glutaredoxin